MICTSMSAQNENGHPQRGSGRSATPGLAQKKHSFYLGVKGGVDFTSMTQPEECDLYDGFGVGYSGGVAGKVRFGKATASAPAGTGMWGAGIEIKYKLNTVKTRATDETGKENAKLSVGYIEVPIYAQFYPFYKSDAMNTFYIEAGPSIAGTMTRSPKTLTMSNLNGEYTSVTYHTNDGGSKLKGMDIRIMAGLGWDFPIKNSKHETSSLIGINARYYFGFNKLAENFNCKMNTIEVSLSWMFNIGNM